EVGAKRHGPATEAPNRLRRLFRRARRAPVVNRHVGTGPGERDGDRSSDSHARPRHEHGLSGERSVHSAPRAAVAARAHAFGFAISFPLSMNALHSAPSAQACVTTARIDAVRCVHPGRIRVCTAPPSTKTAIAERRAKVAGGEVRRLKSRSAASTARFSGSAKPTISSLTSRPVPMKKKMTIDWENRDRGTVGIAYATCRVTRKRGGGLVGGRWDGRGKPCTDVRRKPARASSVPARSAIATGRSYDAAPGRRP